MMRKIKFRGMTRKKGEKVRLDGSPVDGNWVYGGIFFNNNGGDFSVIYQQYPEIKKFPVYSDTVGQYTGLHDKNGKEIYEGDIVLTQEFYDKPYSKNRKAKRHIGIVEYKVRSGTGFLNKETGKWDRLVEYGAEWKVKVKDYGKFVHSSWGDFWDCEVIGNIYENADLLN